MARFRPASPIRAERQLHHPIDDNDIAPSFDVEVGLTSAHA
jgi:hypothetical protein